MSDVSINLLGSPSVLVNQRSVQVKLSKSIYRLIALLYLSNGQPLARDQIAGTLWPEHDDAHARKSLNTAIWRTRRSLIELGCCADLIFQSDCETVGLACSLEAIDAYRFSALLKDQLQLHAVNSEDVDLGKIGTAIETYHGDLLDGYHDDDWLLQHRNYLCGRFQAALNMQLEICMRRNLHQMALEVGQRMLSFDPLQEHVHRELIKSYLCLGDDRGAENQLAECRKVLWKELGVEPMPETLAALSDRGMQIVVSPRKNGVRSSRRERQDCLQLAAIQLDQARAFVRQAMQD